jgi:5,6-dimethylbenzimidazole synthase
MEVYEAIQKRKSIRKFKAGMVPDETIHRLLEAGTQAPNAFNKEQWEFILIKDKALQDEIAQLRAKIPPQKIALESAPLILVSRQVYNVALYLDTHIQFEGIEHEKIHRNTF